MLLCSDSCTRQAGDDPSSVAGYAYRFESRPVNRLLGRGGRMADTPDPCRYAALFRRLRSEYGGQLRYGFMLPINLLLSGVVAHPIYHERRMPQMAPLALFVRQGRFWSVRAVIWVMSAGDPAMADTGKFTRTLVVLLIGSGLGWTGALAYRPPIPADGIHTGPSIERMSALSQLLTLRIDVADVLVSRIDGMTGGVQLAMLVKGDVALGIDLSQARFDKIDNAHCTALLILPPPQASCAGRPRPFQVVRTDI